jgi:hypothetical protein
MGDEEGEEVDRVEELVVNAESLGETPRVKVRDDGRPRTAGEESSYGAMNAAGRHCSTMCFNRERQADRDRVRRDPAHPARSSRRGAMPSRRIFW